MTQASLVSIRSPIGFVVVVVMTRHAFVRLNLLNVGSL